MAVRCPMRSFPLVRHSRAGGNPVITRTPLDSRLRGNDLLWIPAFAGTTYCGFPPARERLIVDSRLRGNDLLAWSVGHLAWLTGPSGVAHGAIHCSFVFFSFVFFLQHVSAAMR